MAKKALSALISGRSIGRSRNRIKALQKTVLAVLLASLSELPAEHPILTIVRLMSLTTRRVLPSSRAQWTARPTPRPALTATPAQGTPRNLLAELCLPRRHSRARPCLSAVIALLRCFCYSVSLVVAGWLFLSGVSRDSQSLCP